MIVCFGEPMRTVIVQLSSRDYASSLGLPGKCILLQEIAPAYSRKQMVNWRCAGIRARSSCHLNWVTQLVWTNVLMNWQFDWKSVGKHFGRLSVGIRKAFGKHLAKHSEARNYSEKLRCVSIRGSTTEPTRLFSALDDFQLSQRHQRAHSLDSLWNHNPKKNFENPLLDQVKG